MTDSDLAQRFDAQRGRLRRVAYRMLGSPAEADDAVQEAWLRLARADVDVVTNLDGWLTTVVARICLDMLRSRHARREEAIEVADSVSRARNSARDPAEDLDLADSIGAALLVVLDTLAPAERVAFVLHDMFDLPFDQIAPIVDRSEPATRQLASRARRRVRGDRDAPGADRRRRMDAVEAFLAAARDGDFERLVALLHPDAVLTADAAAVQGAAANEGRGAPRLQREVRGARAVADIFKGRAQAAEPALVDGEPGAMWAPGGTPHAVFVFTIKGDRIAAIDVVVEPARLAAIGVERISGRPGSS